MERGCENCKKSLTFKCVFFLNYQPVPVLVRRIARVVASFFAYFTTQISDSPLEMTIKKLELRADWLPESLDDDRKFCSNLETFKLSILGYYMILRFAMLCKINIFSFFGRIWNQKFVIIRCGFIWLIKIDNSNNLKRANKMSTDRSNKIPTSWK